MNTATACSLLFALTFTCICSGVNFHFIVYDYYNNSVLTFLIISCVIYYTMYIPMIWECTAYHLYEISDIWFIKYLYIHMPIWNWLLIINTFVHIGHIIIYVNTKNRTKVHTYMLIDSCILMLTCLINNIKIIVVIIKYITQKCTKNEVIQTVELNKCNKCDTHCA